MSGTADPHERPSEPARSVPDLLAALQESVKRAREARGADPEPEPPLTTADGWCATAEWLPPATSEPLISLPEVSVARGGISFRDPAAVERKPYAETVQMYLHLHRVRSLQDDAIKSACHTALMHSYDIHLQWDTASPFIGIEFTRPMRWPIPTIHEHHSDMRWWDLEDEEDDVEGCPDCHQDTVTDGDDGGPYCTACGWRP